MNGVMATAVSGLTASSMWMDAIASNIANSRDESAVPATPPSEPVTPSANTQPVFYQPLTVAMTPESGGGVSARVAPQLPSYTAAYDPSAPFANSQGMVAMPNVDLATQFVDQKLAMTSYRANLAVIRAEDKMMKATLDIAA